MAAQVEVNGHPQIRIKLLNPNVESYVENVGYLANDENNDPIILTNSDTLSAAVAEDLNDALNGIVGLTNSTVIGKFVDYTMEVSNA